MQLLLCYFEAVSAMKESSIFGIKTDLQSQFRVYLPCADFKLTISVMTGHVIQ